MTDSIVGREEEKGKLQKIYNSKEPQLLAVYGRRRVGKTYLISEYFREKGIYFELTGVAGGTFKEQLWRFSKIFREVFPMSDHHGNFKNWDEAFDALVKEAKSISREEKVILFFDELPWLATPRSGLLSALEYAWNRYFSKMPHIIVILCGSAASWMIKKIIQNKGGFYGRLTDTIHLQPLNLREVDSYLKNRDVVLEKKQLVEIFMVTGGIPKYLNHIEAGLSSAQIIQALCFTKSGFLSSEFKGLFRSLFEDSERHLSIIRLLGETREGLTLKEIAHKTSQNLGGHLSEILGELESSGFIQMVPFYGKKKQEGHYRLIDEYSLFYLNWIEPFFKSSPQPLNQQYWLTQHQSARFLSWAGYAFENLCFRHLQNIVEALKIGVVAKNASYWKVPGSRDKSSGAQVDLIIERFDKTLHLCEIKFCGDLFSIRQDYSTTLNKRREKFRELTRFKGNILNTLITTYGATKNSSYLSSVDHEIHLNDLI